MVVIINTFISTELADIIILKLLIFRYCCIFQVNFVTYNSDFSQLTDDHTHKHFTDQNLYESILLFKLFLMKVTEPQTSYILNEFCNKLIINECDEPQYLSNSSATTSAVSSQSRKRRPCMELVYRSFDGRQASRIRSL